MQLGDQLDAILQDGADAGKFAGLLAAKAEGLGLLYLGEEGGNGLYVHGFGFKSGQSQDDGLAGAVPLAGLAQ